MAVNYCHVSTAFLKVNSNSSASQFLFFTDVIYKCQNAMSLEELNKIIETEKEAIEFALERKLLPEKHVICPICNIGNVGWYKRSHEGLKIPYALRCSRKKCRKKWSVTKNTWFFGSHLTVKQNILLIYSWVKGDTVSETSDTLKLSNSTVMDYYQFCREVCYTIVSNRTKPIGGFNETISLCNFQINKFIDKQKKTINFLEGVNQTKDDCFLIEIHSQKISVLLYLIKKFILPGTTVRVNNFSDFFKISDYQNEFEPLNIKFVDHIEDLETMSLPQKCLWRTAKKLFEDENSSNRDFTMFQYLYFHPIEMLSLSEKFERFLNDVAKVYPGPFKIPLTPIIY